MGQKQKTSITVTEGQKASVIDLQDHLESELGVRPTQGEAVAIASERITEGAT